ncbi:hypothetical protein DDB_G0288083 [Dictyostelium discoideum AX4]|uniref:Uncharacterized protein n=1 Tax=Dictyostelium discoideum TaxID=44689 RepID=Q54JF4_DICDI|nr:hypothetical protein DDB_G0288083 [Dictyostelium discoideum AX4]EAL63386.1 hypothetical protein DDB_G0288083 [Dictyostelium discoideum AX4]|eukprot:XP_636896.1 hypothetical protein DDB_G0288083 [Dictyostelium discoideum AX4]
MKDKKNNTDTNKLEIGDNYNNNNNKDKNGLEIKSGDIKNNNKNNNNSLVELKLPLDISLAKFNYNIILGVKAIYVNKNTIKVSHSKYFNISKLLPFFGYNINHIKEILNPNKHLVIETYKELLYIIYETSVSDSINSAYIFRALLNHVCDNNMRRVGFNHTMIDFDGGVIRRPDFYFVSMKYF